MPRSLKPVYAVFLKVAHAIGWFNTRVILILVYFVLITPLAIIIKIFRKDSLGRKTSKNVSSYWVRRMTVKAAKEQLEKQF